MMPKQECGQVAQPLYMSNMQVDQHTTLPFIPPQKAPHMSTHAHEKPWELINTAKTLLSLSL